MNVLGQFRNNRRLRIGFALVAWILAVNAVIDWYDALDARRTEYRRSLGQLARLTPGQPLEVWNRRAADGARALDDARGLLWRNASAGLAQAQVQDWLNDILRRAAAQGTSVRVAEPDTVSAPPVTAASAPGGEETPRPLRARIEFNTDPAVMLALLAALNDAEHRIGVDTLSVRPGKTEMSLTFWFGLASVSPRADAGRGR
jgi:hypothetical protein